MKLLLHSEGTAGSTPNLAPRLIEHMRIFIQHLDTTTKPKWVQTTATTDWLLVLEPTIDGPGFKLINHELVYETASAASITLGQVDQNSANAEHNGLLRIHAEAFRAANLTYLTQQLGQKKQLLDEQLKDKQSNGISYTCPLTLELMEDPVTAPDGITYERQALKQHLTSNHASATRSPATNQPFENLANFNVDIAPQNFLYKQLIQAYFPLFSEISELQRDIAALQAPLTPPVRPVVPAANHQPSPRMPHHLENPRTLATTASVGRPYPVAAPEARAVASSPPSSAASSSATLFSEVHRWLSFAQPVREVRPETTAAATSTTIKMILVGDANAKKTLVLLHYLETQSRTAIMKTIGNDFESCRTTIDGAPVNLQIWDTAGQERFRAITQSHYHGTHALLLMYSAENQQSFTYAQNWLRDLSSRESLPASAVIHLVATDCATENRVISTEAGQALAIQYRLGYSECDALNRVNIKAPFETAARQVLQNQQVAAAPSLTNR